jgi:hypothetical protein
MWHTVGKVLLIAGGVVGAIVALLIIAFLKTMGSDNMERGD